MASPSNNGHQAFDPFAEPPTTTAVPHETSSYGSTAGPTYGANTTAVGVTPAGTSDPKGFYDGAGGGESAGNHTERAAAPPEVVREEAPRTVPTSKVWKIEFYQQFFDVNTTTVAMRLFSTLFPLKAPDFLADRNWHYNGESAVPASVEDVPPHSADLYGPFWLCTTLWMLVGIVSNVLNRYSFVKYNTDSTVSWTYDFSVTSIACWVMYLYCFAFGSAVWGIMKWKNLPATLVDTVCLYGYSMFIFIIVTAICTIPVNVLHWVVVVVGGAYSTLYLLVNFWRMWKAALEPQWFTGIVALVAGAHIGLALLFKLYFFHYKL